MHLWLVSIRFLIRNKFITFICTLTMVLATLAASPFLGDLYLSYTRDYNLKHKNSTFTLHGKNKDSSLNNPHYPIYSLLSEFPDIKLFTRSRTNGFLDHKQVSYQYPNGEWKNILSGHFTYIDPNYFEIFKFQTTTPFQPDQFVDPNRVLLSEEFARKLFQNLNILGEQIILDRTHTLVVVGLYKKTPNRPIPDMLISRSTLDPALREHESEWFWFGGDTYHLVLQEDANPNKLAEKINTYLHSQKRIFPDHSYAIITYPESAKQDDIIFNFVLFIGILIVAMSNYINLTAGFTEKLAKELGMRRILGSSKNRLVLRILVQHVIILSLAFLISMALITPFFRLFGENISLDGPTIIFLWMFIPLTLVLAVLYPAIVFSRIKPLNIIRTSYSMGGLTKFSKYRSGLIILQLALSLVLIINTLVFNNYSIDLKSRDIGWTARDILYIDFKQEEESKANYFINGLLKNPQIQGITKGSGLPTTSYQYSFNFPQLRSSEHPSEFVGSSIKNVASNYFEFFNLELVAGREPSDNDNGGIWITQKLAFDMGVEIHDILGNTIEKVDNIDGETRVVETFVVQGIIKDYTNDLQTGKPRPNAFVVNPSEAPIVFVKHISGAREPVATQMEKEFQSIFPDWYVSINDVEESFEDWGIMLARDIFGFVAAMALVMTLLGLIGLLIQIGLKNKKQFCIRMVFGCLKSDLLLYFLKRFGFAILIGIVLGLTLFYFQMDIVLGMISDKISITPMSLIQGVLFVILMVIILLSLQVWNVFRKNPAEVLKE